MVNFPASLDSLTNPTASDKTNAVTVPHATQHANLNDIAEALEAKVGIGATTPDATHKTTKATAAGTSAWGYYGAVLLDEKTGTGASGVIEFSNINQNFGSLLLIGDGRSDTAATNVINALTFETSPTSGAYNAIVTVATGSSTVVAETIGSVDYIPGGVFPGASSTANLSSAVRLEIANYANTTRFKTVMGQNAEFRAISSGNINVRSIAGCWESTAAIDRIRLTLAAGNWTTSSHFKLYGLPGA